MRQGVWFRARGGRMVLIMAIALLLGAAHPFGMTLYLLPFPVVSVTLLAAPLISVAGGWAPVLVLCGTALVSSLIFMGTFGMLVLPMWLAPLLTLCVGLGKGWRFGQKMERTLIAALAGTALSAALVALVYGGDIVAQVMDEVRATFESIGPAAWGDMLLTLDPTVRETITYQEYQSLWYLVLRQLQHNYEVSLLADLLTGMALSSVLAVFWGSWRQARRGEGDPETYKGLWEWHLPANLTFGLLLMIAASLLLRAAGASQSEMLWAIVRKLSMLAFIVQFFSALDRRGHDAGATRGQRTATIVLSSVVAIVFMMFGLPYLYAALGLVSALFGRSGAIRPWLGGGNDQQQ